MKETKNKNNNDLIIGGLALIGGAYFLLSKNTDSSGSDTTGAPFTAPSVLTPSGETVGNQGAVTKKDIAMASISLAPFQSSSFFGDVFTAGSKGFSGTAYGAPFETGLGKGINTLVFGSNTETGYTETYVTSKKAASVLKTNIQGTKNIAPSYTQGF
jgi:hypothetical protein